MLGAQTMPCSDDSALQERECGFNRIRVNIPMHIDLILVPDGLVTITLAAHCERIKWMLICDQNLDILRIK